jgi:predicted transposase YdaD
VDVAEAQIRLFRRERLPVLSHVWDLYGRQDQPLLQERTLHYGASRQQAHSLCVYQRVNLRALRWEELLGLGLPSLWPLVPLTRDGASLQAVRQARAAIEGRGALSTSGRADHLAVLSFVAEAEGLSAQALRAYISKEELMGSTLYREILAEGVKEGEKRGERRGKRQGVTQVKKETILRILTSRLGHVEPSVLTRLQALTSSEALSEWYEEALQAVNARLARKLLAKITSSLPA